MTDWKGDMPERHVEGFFKAAKEFQCVIGVREPNKFTRRWYLSSEYVAKPHICKAKTASHDFFDKETGKYRQVGGLVADPTVLGKAFDGQKMPQVLDLWNEFVSIRRPKQVRECERSSHLGFGIIKDGPNRGLVIRDGRFIFSDYDLMFIQRWSPESGILEMTLLDLVKTGFRIRSFFNRYVNKEMIQHGAVFTYRKGIGANAGEFVNCFYPNGAFRQEYSSMPSTQAH